MEELKTKIADLTEAIEDREESWLCKLVQFRQKGILETFVEFLLEADNVADALAVWML